MSAPLSSLLFINPALRQSQRPNFGTSDKDAAWKANSDEEPSIPESSEIVLNTRVFIEQLILQSLWPLNIIVIYLMYGSQGVRTMRVLPSFRHREENVTLVFQFLVTSVGIVSLALFLTTPEVEDSARAPGFASMLAFELTALWGGILFHCTAVALKYAFLASSDYKALCNKNTHYTLLLDDQIMSGWMPLPLQLAEREVFASCTFFGDSTFSAVLDFRPKQFREFLATLTPVARDHAAFHAEVKEIEVAHTSAVPLAASSAADPGHDRCKRIFDSYAVVRVPLPALALTLQLNARDTVVTLGNWLFIGSIPVAAAAALGPAVLRAFLGLPVLGSTWRDGCTSVGCMFSVCALIFGVRSGGI